MSVLQQAIDSIAPPDAASASETQRLLDRKTKPPRSLGRLEDLACWLSGVQGTTAPTAERKAIVVMAADHGVAEEGVSAFPQSVTGQMVRNFASGGAGVCVLARHAGADLQIVDMGVKELLSDLPSVKSRRLGHGTENFARRAAMDRETVMRGLEIGVRLAGELAKEGYQLVGLGEMGIANTTSASAVAAALLGLPGEAVTGHGTGVDEAGWRRKVDVIDRALERHHPDADDAIDVLSKVGGYEIVGLAGLVIGASSQGLAVLVDGFISGVAALAAVRIAPGAKAYLEASHGSVEPGHQPVMEALGKRPLLDLNMRLGEGTGAALAMTLVDASLKILNEMATFDSAGVSESDDA